MKNNLFRQMYLVTAPAFMPVKRGILWTCTMQNRERIRLQSEMSQIRGLMPLLMKQRNGYRWSVEDRSAIREQLHMLLSMSPYLVLFVSPGGFVALPLLAWWLDRRRQKRADQTAQPLT